jgi:L-arabinose isomerase
VSAGRIAVLVPYWDFWESSVPGDFRADRRALGHEIAEGLRDVDVLTEALVDSRTAGEAAARTITEAGAEAVLVVQSMAVPPAFTLAALEPLGDLPLVVLVVQRRKEVGAGFSHADVTTEGATVGGPQLVNVLHRTGRPHDLVIGRLGEDALWSRLSAALVPAVTAGKLRRARIGRVGRPVDGYDCVDVDDATLRIATGIELVPIAPAAIRGAYLEADPARIAEVEQETRAVWKLAPGVEDRECLERSIRFAAALESVDDELRLDAGAMNCHVAELRFADEPGITPCFALGRETSRGVPWSCAGDVVTAVAMLTTKLLGAAALYHEIEAIDYARGEVVLANSGEHDLAWADAAERPELRRNVWFDASDRLCGACACISSAAGPATLVGFTPHAAEPSGFRFIVAEGELTGREFPSTGTANGSFRFAGGEPVDVAWARWAGAGVNHHASATPGLFGDAVELVARHLDVGCVRVS